MTKPKKKQAVAKPGAIIKRPTPGKRGRTSTKIKNTGLANPEEWFVEWAGGMKSASGERVNEVSALGLAAYLACLKNISEDVAKQPLGIYEKLDPRGSKYLSDHPVTMLLHNQPNPEMSAFSFRETMTMHALGWHGGFAEIVRSSESVVELWPLDPTCVERCRDNYGDGRLFYRVHGIEFNPRDIFDLHGLGYNGLTGFVLSHIAKDVIGNALAAQKFSGSFFANGIVTSGVIQVDDAMTETAFKHLRESFYERHSGAKNQYKPIILEQGAKWQAQSGSARDAQMLEVLQDGVVSVCRLFRMPPHKIQHLLQATFSNIEHQSIEYGTDTIMPWDVRWEQEIWRKLLFPKERTKRFAKHNMDMILRGDTASRSAYYREMFNIGALSVNDVRDKEDLNPVTGGEARFVNAALVPLEMAAKGEHLLNNQPAQAGNTAGTPPKQTEDAPSGDPNASLREHQRELLGHIAAAHTRHVEDALASVLHVEHDKITRAAKQPGFDDWLNDFYGDSHPEHVWERLSPAILALSASLDADLPVSELLGEIVARHVARSLADLRDPSNYERWLNRDRARGDALDIVSLILRAAIHKKEQEN